MIKIFLYTALLAFAVTSHAQGLLSSAARWYIADTVSGQCILKNHSLHPVYSNQRPIEVTGGINYHPAFLLNRQSKVSFDIGDLDIHQATFFTVYQLKDTIVENMIWHIEKEGKPQLLLTNKRMADFDKYKYMNFFDLHPLSPKIQVYEQTKEMDSLPIILQQWNIGQAPSAPKLPVQNLDGSISELIAFTKNLSKAEKLKIESYLALKYGITLSEPEGTYLNSAGEILWNGVKNNGFHHNVTGIGRDDSSGLHQIIATSSNHPELLSIRLKQDFKNNEFIIWGDNNLSMIPKTENGQLARLHRTWMMSISSTETNSFKTEIILDTKQIFTPGHSTPVFWLAIDSTESADFSASHTQYIRAVNIDTKGFAHFNIELKKNPAGKLYFSFITGQELMMTTQINEPTCDGSIKGQLKIKIIGGTAPYGLTITDKNHASTQLFAEESNSLKTIQDISPGFYVLEVKDAHQQVYTDTIIVNNLDGPNPIGIRNEYILSKDQNLLLNASETMEPGVSYIWEGPNHFSSSNPKITVQEKGVYHLNVSKNGCTNIRTIYVLGAPVNNFRDYILYPNPSEGIFNIKILLYHPASIEVTVYTSNGIPVIQQKVFGADHYILTNKLTESGIYFINLDSNNSSLTKKLIITH